MTSFHRARARLNSVGTTLTAADLATLLTLLAFARRNGFAQTPAVVKLTQKVQRLAESIDRRREAASESQSQNAA